jgi:hypothetical protein
MSGETGRAPMPRRTRPMTTTADVPCHSPDSERQSTNAGNQPKLSGKEVIEEKLPGNQQGKQGKQEGG